VTRSGNDEASIRAGMRSAVQNEGVCRMALAHLSRFAYQYRLAFPTYGGSLRVDVSIFEIDPTFEIVKYPNIKYHSNPPPQLTVYAILLLIEIVKYIK